MTTGAAGYDLWVGRVYGHEAEQNRLFFVVTGIGDRGRPWFLGALSGSIVRDQFVQVLALRPDVAVFELVDGDYGSRTARFTFWSDTARRMVIASRRDAGSPDLAWAPDADSLVPVILSGGAWLPIRTKIATADVSTSQDPNTSGRLTPDTASHERRVDLADGSALVVLDSVPGVLLGRRGMGVVRALDTAWTKIPEPTDSVRRLAWTWQGQEQEYEYDSGPTGLTQVGDRMLSGCGFYGSEGMNGVGGLVVFTPRTGELVVHRWPEILRASAGPIVGEGDSAWVALSHNHEYGTAAGGMLVVDLNSAGVTRIEFPDVVRRLSRAGGRTFVAGETSLGIIEGRRVRRWVPVQDPVGRWIALEAREP